MSEVSRAVGIAKTALGFTDVAPLSDILLGRLEDLFKNPSFERGVLGSLAGIGAGDLINHFINHPEDKATPTGSRLRYAIVDLHNNTVIKHISAPRLYRLLSRPRGRKKTRVVVVRQPTEQINVR